MNLAETSDLLTYLARVDNRRVDDATAIAWQSILGDLELADCLAAAREHYGTSDAYLMPVHIIRLVDDLERARRRAEQALREAAEGLVRGPGVLERRPVGGELEAEDRTAELKELLARLAEKLGPSDPTILRRREWVEMERKIQRTNRAEPNPHYVGPPPPGGHPVPTTVEGS